MFAFGVVVAINVLFQVYFSSLFSLLLEGTTNQTSCGGSCWFVRFFVAIDLLSLWHIWIFRLWPSSAGGWVLKMRRMSKNEWHNNRTERT